MYLLSPTASPSRVDKIFMWVIYASLAVCLRKNSTVSWRRHVHQGAMTMTTTNRLLTGEVYSSGGIPQGARLSQMVMHTAFALWFVLSWIGDVTVTRGLVTVDFIHIPIRLLQIFAHALKWKCLHFDEIFITGCTGSWLHRKLSNDNFRCSQWWQFRQNNISLSVCHNNTPVHTVVEKIEFLSNYNYKWQFAIDTGSITLHSRRQLVVRVRRDRLVKTKLCENL